jgi:hypothetical protein
MVEATDFANRDDPAEFRPLNWPAVGRILVEREVTTRPVVVPVENVIGGLTGGLLDRADLRI